MTPVELSPQVVATPRQMGYRGEQPPRCHEKQIFDGATPYSTYLRGVIIDGDCGVLLTGRDGSALITEGGEAHGRTC